MLGGSKCTVAVLACMMLASCSSTQPSPYPTLSNCSSDYATHFSKTTPDIAPELALRALLAASDWATQECYLPCDEQMCGAITAYQEGKITVYVTAAWSLKPGVVAIVPEAEVVLNETTMQPVDDTFWHNGCYLARQKCRGR
jgi:hypothetical protein